MSYNFDRALAGIVDHLKNGRADNFPAVKVNSIKAYAGEIKNATKLSAIKPAILPMLIDSNPLAEIPEHQIDILIVTASESYNRDTNREGNIELSSQVVNYISENSGYEFEGEDFSIDLENCKVKTLLQDNKFTILVVSLVIRESQD